jgi:hypothetical protein
MQLTSRALRAALALVLAGGFGAGTLAEPASAEDSTLAPVGATYRFTSARLYLGQPVVMNESDVIGESHEPMPLRRYVNWGDRSQIHEFAWFSGPQSHTYVTPGRYRVSVHLKILADPAEGDGTFPDGNTVAVWAVPGTFKLDRTSAPINNDHPKATVRVAISAVPGDVRNVRIYWGDGKSTTARRGTRTLSHAYGRGTFEVTAAVVNGNGPSLDKRVGTVKVSSGVVVPTPRPPVEPPAPEAGGDELPITGPGAGALGGAGAALVLLGLASLLVARRRSSPARTR